MDTSAILIAGPTASGKSALALALAEAITEREGAGAAAIVNADSQQVYAELRVLTARPTQTEEARAPHHLYGHRSVTESYSVAAWRADALEVVDALAQAGQVPIVVGGTGLYFKALLDGIAEIPAVPIEIREAIRRRLDDTGSAALHDELAECDPETAARLDPGDGQRIARALEVLAATGLSITAWQREAANGEPLVPAAKFVLGLDRPMLHRRIERRLEQMIAHGAVDEVASLHARGLDLALPALKAVGVPELIAHLDGELTLDAAVERAQTATRRFAKRQMTWSRNQMADWMVLDGAQQLESIVSEIFPFIRHFC